MTLNLMIKSSDLSVRYGDHLALDQASVELRKGEILAVAGPNGAGKSSLILGLLGLADRTSGQVWLDGCSNQDANKFRRAAAKVAYVPQKQSVATQFPITVRQVVEMGQYGQLGWFQRPSAQQRQAVDRAMNDLELTAVANRQFSALSGGQQQKALVARAIAQGSALLVLDEPFRGVDAKSQRAIVAVLKAHQANGGSAILVHHGVDLIVELADRLAVVNCQVVAQGEPAELLKSPRIAELVNGLAPAASEAHDLGPYAADNDVEAMEFRQPHSLAS